MELSGGVAQPVSPPIENELQAPLVDVAGGCALSWEPALNEVWLRGLGATGSVMAYSAKLQEWKRYVVTTDTGTVPIGLTAGPRATSGASAGESFFRAPRWSCYSNTRFFTEANTNTPDLEQASLTGTAAWSWATPLADLGALVPGYRFGGFFVYARKTLVATSPVNLTWTVYAGSTPYTMTVRGTGAFDYSQGFLNQRSPIGPTLDETFTGT